MRNCLTVANRGFGMITFSCHPTRVKPLVGAVQTRHRLTKCFSSECMSGCCCVSGCVCGANTLRGMRRCKHSRTLGTAGCHSHNMCYCTAHHSTPQHSTASQWQATACYTCISHSGLSQAANFLRNRPTRCTHLQAVPHQRLTQLQD